MVDLPSLYMKYLLLIPDSITQRTVRDGGYLCKGGGWLIKKQNLFDRPRNQYFIPMTQVGDAVG